MKKVFISVCVLGIMGIFILLAIEKNLGVIKHGKETKIVTISEEQAEEETLSEPAVAEEPQESPLAAVETISETPLTASPQSLETQRKVFLEEALHIIRVYQKANQKFLNDRLAKALELFRHVSIQSSALNPVTPVEKQVQEFLIEAAESRLRGIRVFNKILNAPADQQVEGWWRENVGYLRGANESISQAVRLTGQIIVDQSKEISGSNQTSPLLEDLQRSTKGILVVSRSGNG
ncbi:MAG TPA: hypothetical protein PKL97_00655 [Candidatus Omnitrophota bacterium]|nr:hypothetical protein [Candidatus Omnitrophota bacterium]